MKEKIAGIGAGMVGMEVINLGIQNHNTFLIVGGLVILALPFFPEAKIYFKKSKEGTEVAVDIDGDGEPEGEIEIPEMSEDEEKEEEKEQSEEDEE